MKQSKTTKIEPSKSVKPSEVSDSSNTTYKILKVRTNEYDNAIKPIINLKITAKEIEYEMDRVRQRSSTPKPKNAIYEEAVSNLIAAENESVKGFIDEEIFKGGFYGDKEIRLQKIKEACQKEIEEYRENFKYGSALIIDDIIAFLHYDYSNNLEEFKKFAFDYLCDNQFPFGTHIGTIYRCFLTILLLNEHTSLSTEKTNSSDAPKHQQTETFETETAQTVLEKLGVKWSAELVNNVLKNFEFWQDVKELHRGKKNIFADVTQDVFFDMIKHADFSTINQKGATGRVKYNVHVLSRILGKEWGEVAARKIGAETLRECGKRTQFSEYKKLNEMYLP